MRSGRVCWSAPTAQTFAPGVPPGRVEIAIIGAGVMGAALAERFASEGRSVAVFDRGPPAGGATAGSTALVLWAADTPLSTLSRQIGFDAAGAAWRALLDANKALDSRVQSLGLDCGWAPRLDVYLEGDVLDERGLASEAELRQAAGLPSRLATAAEIADRFDLPRRAGLVSETVFAVDPIKLTQGLLTAAIEQGAALVNPADVTTLRPTPSGIELAVADGGITIADRVILATGYQAARDYLPERFSLGSSYAIASPPDQAPEWLDEAMVWEARDPYLYARRTEDGRIIVGGLDEEVSDPKARDALLPKKRRALEKAAEKILGRQITSDCAWAATFGKSPDGLPAIGPSRTDERIWLAYGFGGNGITFASLAAGLISRAWKGDIDPALQTLSPYRHD